MKKIKNINYFLFIILILCIILILLYYRKKLSKQINNPINNYNLEKDGLHIIKNILSNDEIYQLKNNYHSIKDYIINNKRINNIIKIHTNKDYQFQDYIFIIKKSSIHTCHRDNNGDFFNKGQKYPSYTIIIYLEKMDKCLGVIPKSHLNKNSFNFNITDPIKNIICNPGDAIIFNANLIHVGTLNKNDNNLRIQMKITHKDDINKINYYNNYNKILNEENNLPFYIKKIQQKLSCMFPIISNLSQNEIKRTSRGTDNGIQIGILQKIYSYLFYGNSNFYDLPNIVK
jgi:hypothetical protein